MSEPIEPVFANSAWVPGPERFLLRGGRWRRLKLRVRYGLFLHPEAGPVLIDTGYTPEALTAPGRSLGLRAYSWALRARMIPEGQPGALLSRFGLTPTDVRHVVVTHFHADHVSGLGQFPNARFIASGAAFERLRARGYRANMRHGVFAELLPGDFADRLIALESRPRAAGPDGAPAPDLFGDGTVIAVDLPGHADGHVGLFFPQALRPLVYGTDAQWLLPALDPARSPRLLPRMIAEDPGALARSAARLHAFGQAGGDVVLCHDPAPTLYDLDGAAGAAP